MAGSLRIARDGNFSPYGTSYRISAQGPKHATSSFATRGWRRDTPRGAGEPSPFPHIPDCGLRSSVGRGS